MNQMQKITNLSASIVSQLMREGAFTPTQLLQACTVNIDKYRDLNAIVTETSAQAERDATESKIRYANNKSVSSLDGIPIVLKDNFCTASIRTTCASVMLSNFVPAYDATVYERLRAAGAVLVGKSNLDQFGMGSGTVDSMFGPTKNFWECDAMSDDFYITGGSSGGSACAVLSGSCFVALGSDTGGSVRNPASYCGLVGLKPTYGLVSRYGLISLVNSMDVPGILSRSVDDCAAVLNCIAGHDPKDSTTLAKSHKTIRLPPPEKLSVKGLRIGIPIEYYHEGLSDEIHSTWRDVASMLADEGALVEQVSMPHTHHSIACYSILNNCEVASNMARYDGIEYGYRADISNSTERLYAETRRSGFNEVVRNRILAGNYFLLTANYEKYFQKALKVRRLIARDFDVVWDKVQLLLTPTTLTTAPKYSEFIRKTNRTQSAEQDYCTQPANMAGIPAVNIPIRKSNRNSLPISLQLMGRNLSEPQLLATAKFIESKVKFRRPNEDLLD